MKKHNIALRGLPLYVASRASIPERSAMWRHLREMYAWPIVSTWIDEADAGQTPDMGALWNRIQLEIIQSAGVILYVHIEDFPLKGAILEAGMALGQGKPVGIYAPGVERGILFAKLGSWIDHPMVKVCDDLTAARQWINAFTGHMVDTCPECGYAALQRRPAYHEIVCNHCDTKFRCIDPRFNGLPDTMTDTHIDWS